MSTAQQAIKVPTRIGVVRFKQVNSRRIAVTCKGMPRIRLVAVQDGSWEGTSIPATTNRVGAETVTMGKNPEQCFKRAVGQFWN